MKVSVFGSSSAGNGYVLELDNGKILLIEAGVPIKYFIDKYPNRWADVIGCLITHEHGDHAKFAYQYLEFGITLYSAKETFDSIDIRHTSKAIGLIPSVMLKLTDQILVFPFKVAHNACNPLAYMIIDTLANESLLFLTDSAYLEYRFQDIDYMMVECNYIDDIVDSHEESSRHWSNQHMSLDTCTKFLGHCDLKNTKEIILIHLSDTNSHEVRMVREISEQTGIKTSAALPGRVYELRKDPF